AEADNVLVGRTAEGAAVLVTVYGRDAWDSQVVGSLWTALTRRGERAHVWGTRRSRVEHEALFTLLAAQAGVPTLDVVAVGMTDQGDALLVTTAPRAALGEATSDEMLAGAWRAVVALNEAGIAHGRIDGSRVVVREDGLVALADFDAATRTSDEIELRLDRAQLLVATALAVGPDRALAAAAAAVGADGLAEVLPFLQPAALGRSTRAAVRGAEWALDELRASAVAAAGVEEPPLERLRRVTPRSVGTVLVVGFLAYVLVTLVAGVDVAAVASALGDADWRWLVAALVVTPWIQVSSAGATMGSITARVRFVPVLVLQYAIQFIALVLPASAARLALQIRFFQKFGIPAATAVTFGVIDSVTGFVVQITLMLVILVSGLPGFSSPLFAGSGGADDGSSTASLVVLLVALVVIGIVIAVAVPRIRRRITALVPRVRALVTEQARSAQSALAVLRRPAKVATMLGGNLGVQLIQACVLGLCLHAFGQSAHFSQLILINTFVSLFSGIMPVPGGMGVTEAGLTVGLQAVGVPSAIAISTALTFRLVTFYLPPIWGAFAMRWLRRHEYV
ncbi:lysylphosphatidylglycerol synthase transmembrane domain-containing protein, partial [Cellulomonas rhizosphaerae]